MYPVDKHFSDILNKSMLLREKRQSVNSNQDEDKRFCLSSYKELKKVPEHGLIRTIVQILGVIQRAQDFDNPPPNQPPYSSDPTNQPSYSNQFGQGPSQVVQPNLHPLIVATNTRNSLWWGGGGVGPFTTIMDKHVSAHSSDPSPTESANSQHRSELIWNCSAITTKLFVIYLWIKISVFTFIAVSSLFYFQN